MGDAAEVIEVAAPPGLPGASTPGALARWLPVATSVAMLGVLAATAASGSVRSPSFAAFPVLMLVSAGVAVLAGRGRSRGAVIDADRADYLDYLGRLRLTVSEIAVAQRESLLKRNPDPDTLWMLVGAPQLWERQPGDDEFGVVRVGTGVLPLAARLAAPPESPGTRSDPVTAGALRQFLRTHSTISDAPVVVALPVGGRVTVDGDPDRARALLAAMICQLAVSHPPELLRIVRVIDEDRRDHWDWLKWLPHSRHPGDIELGLPSEAGRLVVLADTADRPDTIAGATVLELGSRRAGAPVTLAPVGGAQTLQQLDGLAPSEALICARRLAGYRRDGDAVGSGWPGLTGIGDVDTFDPAARWQRQNRRDRLRVPIGTTADGAPLLLDIKESAEHGSGPHGLCVGATGSGKSELLRTVVLGMMALNSPEVLNVLLIDFKGGATFLDLAISPHVSAVITNLADDAPLVARMREALAGEVNRRQQLLRSAGNVVSISAYEHARRGGARLTALPTLFIVVDEFSELLSQHPDFADVFVMIGRLGRSLGMHLLLASQRLEEGRLRGLDAHLSYRICLKTLSASESRAVLGTADAYELPNVPGWGILRCAGAQPLRFQAAYVSGPLPRRAGAEGRRDASVRLFTAEPAEPVSESAMQTESTLLQAVLERLRGHGPDAHPVWLAPLQAAPQLGDLLPDAPAGDLAVPIGVVDRPFEQRRTPLLVDLSGAAGNVAVVGAPRSGKSTTLRTLVTALAATHDAGRVWFYCLDFGGGELAALSGFPQVGAVAGRSQPELVVRVVRELESMLRSRETAGANPRAQVFLVVDGWANLRHEFEELEESITVLARQGLSFGVHVLLSASRWAEIRPALRDQIGTRLELRLGDPADSELDRKRAQQVPPGRPGRGLARDGSHMIIARPEGVAPGCGATVAPTVALLPHRVDHDALLGRARDRGHVLLGLEECRSDPVAIDFAGDPHLLVVGEGECGKSAALRTLCREIARTKTAEQARLLIVDYRRGLLGVVESEHLGGYATSPDALSGWLPDLLDLLRRRMPPPDITQAQLRARSWWRGPDVYLLVDDYDVVAARAGNPLPDLLGYLPHARDLGLHVIVAHRGAEAGRALFDPLLTGLRDLGCPSLTLGSRPERTVLGSARSTPRPPGRGVLATGRGTDQVIQVAWSEPPP